MSKNNNIPRLCGGTFFVLLRFATQSNTDITDPVCMRALMQLYRPEFLEKSDVSFARYTSEFKNCKSTRNNYLGFGNDIYINTFNERIINNYATCLGSTESFVRTFFTSSMLEKWFVRALIELIEADSTIDDEALFFIQTNGIPVKKSEFSKLKTLYSPAVLLGVWHFITTNILSNEVGRETYEEWHKSGTFKNGIGTNQKYELVITTVEDELRSRKSEDYYDPMQSYYDSLSSRKKLGLGTDVSDFVFDLVNNVCLMYSENNNYCFIHRSFQEYFCALFFSKQKDRTLSNIGNMFETTKNREVTSDKTFDMLYDMIPEKVEEYIFLPLLEEKMLNSDYSYHDFLKDQYPAINYSSGRTFIFPESYAQSFLFSKLTQLKGLVHKPLVDCLNLSDLTSRQLIDTSAAEGMEFVFVKEIAFNPDAKKNMREDFPVEVMTVMNKDEIPEDYVELYGEPKTAGWTMLISLKEILEKPKIYPDLINAINKKGFPLKDEYEAVSNYFRRLQDIKNSSSNSADLFDIFD